jgi:hypothetical protein
MRTNSKKKTVTIIEKKLNKLSIDKLSKQSKFCKRKPKKITPKELLIGFFMMALTSEKNSYKSWAMKIGLLIKDTVSKQALWKRMQPTQIIFLQKVLAAAIDKNIENKLNQKTNKKLKQFNNVILEDSTHIKLSDKLWKEYPGNGYSGNRHSDTGTKKAIIKIQAAYNIIKKNFTRFEITSFRSNDQGYAEKILEIIKKGDLIIRDLGYFVLKVFKKLDEKGVFYISRMKKGMKIISKEEEKTIDLAKMLKRKGQLDIEVFFSEEQRLPVRLIAIPVEKQVASERRRKAKTNRDKRYNPSKENLFLLGWELFITNVPKESLELKDVAEIYFMRWRIEIIFKCWKSYFKITDIPKDANKIRVESYIYCMLIFIVLFQVNFYNYYMKRLSTKSLKVKEFGLSMMKLMQYVVDNINMLVLGISKDSYNLNKLLDKQISYYCLYETRHDRVNYYEKINN